MNIKTKADIGFILAEEYPSVHPDVLDSIINRWYIRTLRADGYTWSRLEIDDVPLPLFSQYMTGTVTATQGSTSITGDGTNAWTSAMDGLNIRIAGRDEFYTLTFNDSNDLTIDHGYEGPSGTSLSYWIFQRIYRIAPDAQEIRGFRVPQINRGMSRMTRAELDLVAASRIDVGYPRVWTPYQDASDGTSQVEIYPTPQAATFLSLSYDYKTAKSELVFPDDPIPSWFPWDALMLGCEVSLSKMSTPVTNRTTGIWAARQQQVNEQDYKDVLAAAISEDINAKPSQQLAMSERFTSHRRGRQYADKGIHWWELHISNQ